MKYKPRLAIYNIFANDFVYVSKHNKKECDDILSRKLKLDNKDKVFPYDYKWFRRELNYEDKLNNYRKIYY